MFTLDVVLKLLWLTFIPFGMIFLATIIGFIAGAYKENKD